MSVLHMIQNLVDDNMPVVDMTQLIIIEALNDRIYSM